MSDEAARRRQLIEATIETLAEVGFNAASLSEIARRAKVSVGLFAHYFGDKEGLLEATLRFVAARLARSTASALRAATTRRERLFAVCEAALADEEFDRRTGAVWLAFWGQTAHSVRYQHIQRIYERRVTSNLRHALQGLVPDDRVGLYAALIAAGIDGLWLRSHTAAPPDAATLANGGSARTLIRAMVEGLLASADAGAFAGPPFSNSLPLSPPRRAQPCPSNAGSKTFRVFPCRTVQVAHIVREAERGLADWAALAAPDRARILHKCAGALRAEAQALARLETLETGRPVRATAADLSAAIVGFEEAATLARGMGRVRIELEGGRTEERRQPRGRLAAGAIHWSRPVLELGALAQVLAHGDALLLRSDPHATRTIAKVTAVLASAGLPNGALTLASEGAAEPQEDGATSFGYAGPKSATVILPGADLEKASRSALLGSRAWTGSTFASQSRVYVHQSIHCHFAEACSAAAAALRVGDPLAQETEVGSLLSQEHGQWIEGLLASDLRSGASVVAGGKTLFIPPSDPPFLAPTIISGCGPTSALVRAETFAPIVTLQSFDTDDEVAIELSKDCPGEAIGIFADDRQRAELLVAACDRPLSIINDDGLDVSDPVWWSRLRVDDDPRPLRRTVIAGLHGGF